MARTRDVWLATSTLAIGLVGGAWTLVRVWGGDSAPSFSNEMVLGDEGEASKVEPDPRGPLRLAGSGSNIPVTRALAAAYSEPDGRRPIVHPSIGSGGGVVALLDGAIDIALVSRPLRRSERERGLVVVPYACVPVAVAVHPNVTATSVTSAQLRAIYAGESTRWEDGSRIVVLQREEGDSSHQVLDGRIEGFAEANAKAYRQRRWLVLYHDDAMRDALEITEGAIGLHGSGLEPSLALRVLSVDGVYPTLEAVERGAYPFTKALSFVTLGPPSPAALRFIAFARSDVGHEVLRRLGAVPEVVGDE